jgi:hypothetical protein
VFCSVFLLTNIVDGGSTLRKLASIFLNWLNGDGGLPACGFVLRFVMSKTFLAEAARRANERKDYSKDAQRTHLYSLHRHQKQLVRPVLP